MHYSLQFSINKLWAPATKVPVQWDLGIEHSSVKKSQELHPEMKQKCHIPLGNSLLPK